MATAKKLEGDDNITDELLEGVQRYVVMENLRSLAVGKLGITYEEFKRLTQGQTEDHVYKVSKI